MADGGKRGRFWNNGSVLTGFVFDEQQSEQVEDWSAAIERLDGGQLLWLALHDPTEEELAALGETLDLGEALAQRLGEHPRGASVADEGERMYVTLYVVNSGGDAPELVPIECVLGVNWIVTAYRERADVLEEFFERVQGGGEVGALDAPSFVATILDWIVSSYLRALDDVERELEDLDARVMTNTPKMATDDLNRLVEIRRTIGTLRRALAPHREVVVSLSHPELDRLSTERSAQRFAALERRVDRALDAAREAKESTFGSFDLLVTRIGQRTNDIMKLLTLATVILLPATVLGGIMGMNFQVGLFDLAWVFWVVIATMLAIAVVVLSFARVRNWI